MPQILSAADLTADLHALGVTKGDGLFVHSSPSKIGRVIGGPRGLIQALLDAVGDSGLIAMPGFSRDAYDPVALDGLEVSTEEHTHIRDQVPGFDQALSNVAQNGATPEAFCRWPGVIRSAHPTSSVLMRGRDAADWAALHDPMGWPTGPETPWGQLAKRPQMKILLIGVRWNRCSALHAAETAAKHRRVQMRHFKLDGQWVDAPDVVDEMSTLFPLVGEAWEATGAVQQGRIGGAVALLADYGHLVAFATAWLDDKNRSNGVPEFR